MKGRIDALTSLRFVAAAAIVGLHSVQLPGFPVVSFGGFDLDHGVSFFYVLSGFILHYNYRGRSIAWSHFVWLRFARIWPLHIFGLAVALGLRWSDLTSWIHAHLSWGSIAAVVLLLQSWSPHSTTYFAINGVSWSISVEMFFYACFLPLCVAFRTRPVLTLTGAVALHLAFIYGTWSIEALHQFQNGLYMINPVSRLLEFVIGIGTAEMWMRARRVEIGTLTATIIEGCVIAAVLAGDLLTMPVVNKLWGFIPPVRTWAYLMWIDLFFALLLFVFASNRGLLAKAMGWRPLIVLGEISFALYLVHQPIQWAVSMHLQSLGPTGMLVTSIVVALAVSAAAHYFIEKPTYSFASRYLAARHQSDRASAVQINC